MPNPAIENALVRMEAPRENVDHLIARAQIINDAINRMMKDGVHYGTIPGTHRKALLKPGAEALQELFKLSSVCDTNVIDYAEQHREVRSKCTISAPDGTVLVQRSGTCTTYETKYRYRNENTGAEVPKEYWKRGTPEYKNPDVLGGPDFFPRKVDGTWMVVHQIPVSNQPDNWHTVGSMAEKRAYVAAIIVACGASDALVPEDDPTYREAKREGRRQQEQRRDPSPRQSTRNDSNAGDSGKRAALIASLEKAGEDGMAALMDAWADLTEQDRVLVGRSFGDIKHAVEAQDDAQR